MHGAHPPQGHQSPFPADIVPESSSVQFSITGGSDAPPVTSPCAFNLSVLC